MARRPMVHGRRAVCANGPNAPRCLPMPTASDRTPTPCQRHGPALIHSSDRLPANRDTWRETPAGVPLAGRAARQRLQYAVGLDDAELTVNVSPFRIECWRLLQLEPMARDAAPAVVCRPAWLLGPWPPNCLPSFPPFACSSAAVCGSRRTQRPPAWNIAWALPIPRICPN